MFFDHWYGLIRIVVVGPRADAALVSTLRVSGNRTLSKMNAFDLIVTAALGSTLATVLLRERIALVEGVMGVAVLVGLQFGMTWLSVRSEVVRRLIKAEPVLLVHRGELLRSTIRRQRVLEAEVLQAGRESGIGSLEEAGAVVLETDGTFSAVRSVDGGTGSTLANVGRPAGA